MVTVLRKEGVSWVIHTNDHRPAHVHVWIAGDEAVLNLNEGLTLREETTMKTNVLAKARRLTRANFDELLRHWRMIHGER